MSVKEWVRRGEPAHPPAEKFGRVTDEHRQRWGRRRSRWQRSAGRAFVEATPGRTQYRIPGTSGRFGADESLVHERMNETNDREARTRRSIADRRPATIGVPAQDPFGIAQAAHGVGACSQRDAARRHLIDVGTACPIEHVGPIEKARESLAVLAVADEAGAGGRRHIAGDAAHAATRAPERKIEGHEDLAMA